MNLIKSTLIAAAVAVTMTGSAFSQTADKAASAKIENIVTVNVQKLLKDYYKTQDALKKLAADEQMIQKENTKRLETSKGLEKEFMDMKKKAEDAATPEAARKKLVEELNLKQASLMAKEQERREFVERRVKSLNTNKQQQMNLLYEEIVKVVNDKAKANSYDLVIDSSANSAGLGNKVFMFAKESVDVTPEILKELNKDAPADFDPEKTPEPGAAPAAAPAN